MAFTTNSCLLVSLFLLGNTVASATVFTLQNSCSYTVWPGTFTGDGGAITGNGGFPLPPGASVQLTAPPGCSGQVWGRTGCNFGGSGNGHCTTGECGGLQCTLALGEMNDDEIPLSASFAAGIGDDLASYTDVDSMSTPGGHVFTKSKSEAGRSGESISSESRSRSMSMNVFSEIRNSDGR